MEINSDQTIPGPPPLPREWRGFEIRAPFFIVPLVAIGTGGDSTNVLGRDAGFKASIQQNGDHMGQAILGETLSEDIETIRSALKVSVAEIARCVCVTRQAVYDWKSGGSIKEANAAKLKNLLAAAETINHAGVELSKLALRRKLPGGRTLCESIAEGSNGRVEATRLLEMLRVESERRAALARKFKGRRNVSTSLAEAAPSDPEA